MTSSLKMVLIVSLCLTIVSVIALFALERDTDGSGDRDLNDIDSSIKVSVLNGCGRSGLASMFAEKLRDLGFDVVNGMGENADSFDYDVSIVVEKKGGSGEKAKNVADALGIKEILLQRSGDPYVIEDVALILGRDWHTLLSLKEE